MKIGIDVDGVLIDFEERMRYKSELFNYFYRNNDTEVKDKNAYWIQDKYQWSKEDWELYKEKYLIELSKESIIKPGAVEVLNLLKKEGNELIIISSRGNDMPEMIDVIEEKILENNIKFDKYYWKHSEKAEICKLENIDVMIDDNPFICENLAKNKIKTFYFRNIYNKELPENEYLKNVYDWGNIYCNLKNVDESVV